MKVQKEISVSIYIMHMYLKENLIDIRLCLSSRLKHNFILFNFRLKHCN